MKQKYIVFDNTTAVMFPDTLVHADVATMQHSDLWGNWERKEPTSAGFFMINTAVEYQREDGTHWPEGIARVGVFVYGESESLKLKSKGEDAKLIALALGLI